MEIEGHLTLTTVDKKVEFTRAENGDVIISFKSRDGGLKLVESRIIPKSEWDFIKKVLK